MKPEKCKGCPLYDAPGPVWGNGPRDAKIVLVGEAPGGEEVASGFGFVGPAGRVLSLALRVAGVDRTACYVTNTVKCLPPKRGKSHAPTGQEVAFCKRAWLDEELKDFKQGTVVAIGGVAFQALTGMKASIEEWRGAVIESSDSGE